jgi:hypothetical protein
MKVEEYISEKNILRSEHDHQVRDLDKKYALSNSSVKIGDIVTDHMGSVKVDKILIYSSSDYEPCCVYRGIEYTKAGKPTKRGNKRDAYQRNLV